MFDLEHAPNVQPIAPIPLRDPIDTHSQDRYRRVHPIAQHKAEWCTHFRQPRSPIRLDFAILDALRTIDDFRERFTSQRRCYGIHLSCPHRDSLDRASVSCGRCFTQPNSDFQRARNPAVSTPFSDASTLRPSSPCATTPTAQALRRCQKQSTAECPQLRDCRAARCTPDSIAE